MPDARGLKALARVKLRSRSQRSDDYAASLSTIGALSIPGSLNGRVESRNDRDWFRLTLAAGFTYQFRQNRISLRDPYLRLLNSGGSVVAADNNSGGSRNSLITFTPSASGLYYLDAGSFKTKKTGTYTVTAVSTGSPTVLDDYAASSATTAVLTIPGSLNGTVEANGDRDWFRLNLTAGQSYQFLQTKGSLADPLLRLRNANGIEIASDDDGGESNNSLIALTPSSSGVYYLDAGSFSKLDSGTYTVSVKSISSPGIVDDFAASSATTGVLTIPGSLNGTVEAKGDRDWFRLNLTAGQSYQFLQTKGSLADPLLRLRNASGIEIASDDDGGESNNSLITLTPTSSGVYYLDAGAFSKSDSGTYTVSVKSISSPGIVDDFAASSATTGVLTIPGSLNGIVETNGDHDWFKLNLTADQGYTFSLTGISLNDPFLQLRDSTGTQISVDQTSSEGSPSSTLTFTPPVSGRYYLDAGSRSNSASGSYTVMSELMRNGCIDADSDFASQILSLYDQTSALSFPDDPDDPNNLFDGRFLDSEEIVEGLPYQRVFLGTSLDDTIIGSAENDIIIPGEGSDLITGGEGADIFFIRKEILDDGNDLKNRILDYDSSQGDLILLSKDFFEDITAFSLRRGSGINNPVTRPNKVNTGPRSPFAIPLTGLDGNEGWDTLFIQSSPNQTSVPDSDAIAHIFVGNSSFDTDSVFILC